MDRRTTERRQRTWAIRWPDRRSGFDRRRACWAAALRDSSLSLVALLAALNVLNVLDLRLTLAGIERGAVEANPVMEYLLSANLPTAGLFKVAVMLAVTFVVWQGRKYRRVLEFAAVTAVAYASLIAYHLVGLTVILH